MDYITKDTTYTSFIPCPRELLTSELSKNAKLAYLHLLERALLSKSNDWVDEEGHVYIIYPVEKLAEAMAVHRYTMHKTLNELDDLGMIERKRKAFGQPNFIYVRMPNIAHDNVHLSPEGDNNRHVKVTSVVTSGLQKTSRRSDTNYNKNSYNKKNYSSTDKEFDITNLLKERGIIQ